MATTIDPLFDPAIVQDPHGYYAQLRELDPVHEIPGTGTFLVTRMALIHEVVSKPSVFSSVSGQFLHLGDRPAPILRALAPAGEEGSGQPVLAAADPPVHTRQRRVVGRRLSAASMAALEPEFRDLVDRHLAPGLDRGRIEWMAELAEPLPMVMVARVLGVADDLAPRLKDQGYAAVEAISGFVSDERLAQLDQRVMDVGPVAEAYMAARAQAAPDTTTLIAVCAQAVADGDLDDMEAFGILFLLVAAGGESTTSLTGTAVRILAERPDLQQRLRTEPRLVPAFVEEACRIDPPFRGHYRHVVTDTELGGVAVPAGATLVLAWPAANHDAEAFAHPDEIDLDRPNPRNHTGFGWGIHLCVGAPLARIEAKVAIEELLARTTSFALDPDAMPLRYHESLMVRRLVALPLVLEGASTATGRQGRAGPGT